LTIQLTTPMFTNNNVGVPVFKGCFKLIPLKLLCTQI
jgi:hypothetical protein